jgi:hypothetical protein
MSGEVSLACASVLSPGAEGNERGFVCEVAGLFATPES